MANYNAVNNNLHLYKKMSRYEIGWWKAHHRKDETKLIEEMARLYHLQFNISYNRAMDAVFSRLRAIREHDIAEKLEDKGRRKEAEPHWKRAESLILAHFIVLDKNITKKQYQSWLPLNPLFS